MLCSPQRKLESSLGDLERQVGKLKEKLVAASNKVCARVCWCVWEADMLAWQWQCKRDGLAVALQANRHSSVDMTASNHSAQTWMCWAWAFN